MTRQELEYISKGMGALCDALSNLRRARSHLEKSAADSKLLLDLNRMSTHLVEAVSDAPNEFWAIMMADHVGVEELRKRLDSLAKELAA